MSHYEEIFADFLKDRKIPFECEFKFFPTRRFRADFAFIDKKILVEIEGAIFGNGRHTRGAGFEKDCEKYNLAASLGFKVYRIPSHWIKKMDERLLLVIDQLH